MPRIDDYRDRLRHARYFSFMNLKSEYGQNEVDERAREKSAFVTPDGLYEFKVLPFGLCSDRNFPEDDGHGFVGLEVTNVLSVHRSRRCLLKAFEEHLERLTSILQTVRSAASTRKP